MYYGLSLNVGNFGLDIYLTQFIFGVVEVPARLGCLPLLQIFGRKICQAVVLLFGGCACLVILAVPKGTLLYITRGVVICLDHIFYLICYFTLRTLLPLFAL